MMVMGYFRSSIKSATTSSSSAGKNKKKKKAKTHEEVGLREALLDQPAAAAEEGGVPKGYFAVYAAREESRRFVVPTGYLREPAFRDLMERAADEFGFAQAGGLRVPCAEEELEDLLRRLQRKNGGAAAGKGKKAVVGR